MQVMCQTCEKYTERRFALAFIGFSKEGQLNLCSFCMEKVVVFVTQTLRQRQTISPEDELANDLTFLRSIGLLATDKDIGLDLIPKEEREKI